MLGMTRHWMQAAQGKGMTLSEAAPFRQRQLQGKLPSQGSTWRPSLSTEGSRALQRGLHNSSYHFPFEDKKTEVQRDAMTCLGIQLSYR